MAEETNPLTEWLEQATEYIKSQFPSASSEGTTKSPEKQAEDKTPPEPPADPPKKKHFWFGEV